MGVFLDRQFLFYSDNDFVVKVIHRVNIDLLMTFRLAIGILVCNIGYWGFSTRQSIWLCFISFQGHLEGMYWPSYDLKTSNRYTELNYRSLGVSRLGDWYSCHEFYVKVIWRSYINSHFNLIRWIPLFFLGKITYRLVLM